MFLSGSQWYRQLWKLNLERNRIKGNREEYIEDITCSRMDMNFIFEWSTLYLTSERRVEHEKIKFISISEYVIFCLLYKHQRNTKSACFQRRNLLCNRNDGVKINIDYYMLRA